MATLKIHNGAWVVVGDGKKALVLHNEGDAELVNLRRLSVRQDDNPPTHEQGTDSPGRSMQSVGSQRSSIEPTDWHQIEEDRFAAALADDVNEAARTHAFKELVVVAPPKVLGELRKAFSPETQKRVVAEIDKDYTHHTIPEIERLLSRHDVG